MTLKTVDLFHAQTEDFESLESRITRWTSRTVEEIALARERLFARSSEPRALPTGKSLEDVIVGRWPGDETDDEIGAFLEDLS